VHTAAGAAYEGWGNIKRISNGLRATLTMREGEFARGVVLESMGGLPRALQPTELQRLADGTAAYWKNWLNQSTYASRWRETVHRSAITLKLMTYQPAGAPVPRPRSGSPSRTASGTGTTGSAGSEMGR